MNEAAEALFFIGYWGRPFCACVGVLAAVPWVPTFWRRLASIAACSDEFAERCDGMFEAILYDRCNALCSNLSSCLKSASSPQCGRAL